MGKNLVTTEVINDLCTLREGFTQFGPGENDAGFLLVRTGAQGSHAVTLVAVEGPVYFHRLAEQVFGVITGHGDAIKDILRLEETVEIADAGMVAADQHVVDPIVLAEGRMQQTLREVQHNACRADNRHCRRSL